MCYTSSHFHVPPGNGKDLADGSTTTNKASLDFAAKLPDCIEVFYNVLIFIVIW